jgi:hypothetical protein
MSSYFECLHCGAVTAVEATPPKCSRCGHGTGVIHLENPESTEKGAGTDQQEKPADGSNKSEGTSDMLPALENAPGL